MFDLAVAFAIEAGEDPDDVDLECRLPNAFLADPPLDDVIAKNETKADLKDTAVKKGFKSMKDDGILKVLEGITDFEALSKVVNLKA